jgi:predicted GNAT family acetyltransferase
MNETLRKLTAADLPFLTAYLSEEPEVNLFFTGDIYAFGLDSKKVSVFASLDLKGAFTGVLLRYMSRNYVFYSRETSFPVKSFAEKIKADNPTLLGVCLSGKSALIDLFVPYLSPLKTEKTMMARCNALLPSARSYPSSVIARPLGKADYPALYVLLSQIEEFSSYASQSEAQAIDGWTLTAKRGSVQYGVFENGILVATASSTADSPTCSMLVGVATAKDHRGHGYASLAVSSLLKDRFEKGQQFLCLFYDNPEAGKIYHGFGFEDVAPYSMLH